jgi:hypothetical protein
MISGRRDAALDAIKREFMEMQALQDSTERDED